MEPKVDLPVSCFPAEKIWFPNLNGLRVIAAAMVFYAHIEQFKRVLGHPSAPVAYPHPELGRLGVVLFFVLSGFLITYLLLQEKNSTKTISISKFYWRRILRIWPLYYLIVLASLFIFPHFSGLYVPDWTETVGDGFWTKTFLFIFFSPHLAMILFPPVAFASQTWSIGVEEQFYLIWPILMKWTRFIPGMLAGVMGLYHLIWFGLYYLDQVVCPGRVIHILSIFWGLCSVDCMAIGGWGAYFLFFRKTRILNFLFSRTIQVILYGLIFLMIGTGFSMRFFTFQLFAVLFMCIIVNLAGNPRSLLTLEFRGLNYLGQISYGIYMYHALAIVIVLQGAIYCSLTRNAFIYPVATLLLIAIAAFSYHFFEKPFIRKKVRYSLVISGDNAHGTV
jgi:peptidoglycan/LPS O-acetylase OafA/YrhL